MDGERMSEMSGAGAGFDNHTTLIMSDIDMFHSELA